MSITPYRIIALSGNQLILAQLDSSLSGYPVTITPVGQNQLIDRVIEISPDVIVVDSTFGNIRHPREICQLLLKQLKNHPVPPVLSLIEATSRQRAEVLCSGVVDWISYPFIPREVMMRIEYSLLLREACRLGLTPCRTYPEFHKLFTSMSKQNELAKRTADYLTQHLAASVTLSQLARQEHTNRNTLSEAFKQTFGCTIFQWLYQRRMEKAAEYLLRTRLGVQQVAYRVGYLDANNFSTAFRKKFHCSPSAYRIRQLQPAWVGGGTEKRHNDALFSKEALSSSYSSGSVSGDASV